MSVRARSRILVAVLVAGLIFGVGPTPPAPAQPLRVIHIAMSSFKFDPDLFFVHEGDRVVLQLENIDPQRNHNFDSPYLSQVEFTVTGQFKQGVSKEGTKYVFVEPGRKAEVTFVAKGHGQFGFVCSLFNHAARGEVGAFVVWPAGYHPATKSVGDAGPAR